MAGVSGHVKLAQRKRGDVYYLKYRTLSGKQVEQKLGPAWSERSRPPAGSYTQKMAEDALGDLLADLRRGLAPDPGNANGAVTFEDAAAEYLRFVEVERQIDADTLADYRGVVNGYLLEEFGDLALEAITADQVDAYKVKLLSGELPKGKRRLSNRTIVRHLTVLHGIFKRAKRAYGLKENPASADLVQRPKVVYTGEFDTLDRDEIELLATSAATFQDAVLYKVAAFTGLRQGELLALRWEHVDFIVGLVHVRRNFTSGREKTPKGKRIRSVPMMPDVVDALAQLKEREHFTEDGDLVFCSVVGEHLDHFALRKDYYAALDRAGLRRVRFHDLRHAFGTAAITKLDPYAVQSYMGHQHYSTTQRYLHHKPRREDAVALAEAFSPADERSASPHREDAAERDLKRS